MLARVWCYLFHKKWKCTVCLEDPVVCSREGRPTPFVCRRWCPRCNYLFGQPPPEDS